MPNQKGEPPRSDAAPVPNPTKWKNWKEPRFHSVGPAGARSAGLARVPKAAPSLRRSVKIGGVPCPSAASMWTGESQ